MAKPVAVQERERGQQRRLARRLSEIPDEQLACRSERHDWPRLVHGKPLPRGISAVRQVDGCYQLREICGVCGKVRWVTTLPRGVFDVNAVYRYEDPADWVVVSADLDVTKRDLKAENIRRNAASLFR